jgi:hypothetical protein
MLGLSIFAGILIALVLLLVGSFCLLGWLVSCNHEWQPADEFCCRKCERCKAEETVHDFKESKASRTCVACGLTEQRVEKDVTCGSCHGHSYKLSNPCPDCREYGYVTKTEWVPAPPSESEAEVTPAQSC